MTSGGLTGRHIGLVEALRAAGVPVSLAEDVDAATAIRTLGLAERETLRATYAATLVKRAAHRPSFDALFDLYFPALVGDGRTAPDEPPDGPQDTGPALAAFREEMAEALQAGDRDRLQELAIQAVARFGAMPGRAPGLSSWSAYQALKRLDPDGLVQRVAEALRADGVPDAERTATTRVARFTGLVEGDARRRVAEEKGPEHVAGTTQRPTIDKIDFTSARRSDLEQMRREIYPLARRLATRLSQEHHSQRRRGPLDFRRTVRASISTGGVPITTHHRPKRPHRTELVVLCDVSGSVANFAQFTLLLVYALRDQFTKVRAFTFVDQVHEVTHHFRPGADVADVMTDLAASVGHAALWGAPTTAGRSRSSRRSTPTRWGRDRPCSCSVTPAPTTATSRSTRSRGWSTGPGTPGGSTPSTPATGTPATPRLGPTPRSWTWSSAATSPSSASSSTTSCDGQPAR